MSTIHNADTAAQQPSMVPPSRQDDTREQESGDGIGRRLILGAGLAGLAGIAAFSRTAHAGPINPPAGPIASTGRTVQEIYDKVARTDFGLAEPRIPVQSLPGSATAQYVISQPGSYYLTGNIQGVAGKNGIEISTGNVTIDLSGFVMIGNGGIAGITTSASTSNVETIRIFNGRLRGWGFRCVVIDGSATFEDLSCQTCPNGGISAFSAIVRRCGVRDAGDWGIRVVERSLVESCAVSGCSTGIEIAGGPGGVVLACKIDACTVGVNVNSAYVARCGIANCGQAGIRAREDCSIDDNAVSRVDDFGIDVTGPNTTIRCNSVTSTQTCYRSTSTNGLFIANAARPRSGGAGYVIPAGNSFGPIVNVAGVGVITSVANANHPWANFIY